jgi:hypothetical protein
MTLALLLCSVPIGVVAQEPAQRSAGTRLRLRRDTVLAGVHCAPTDRAYAVLHPSGALDECPLANDSAMAGHRLPQGM